MKKMGDGNVARSDVRVVNQMLSEMDGLVKRHQIYIMAATNRPGPCDLRVSKQNFEEAFKKVRPSVSKEDQLMYENLRESLTGQ
ncbi:hypothetical protein Q7C36_001739 [Tachysurus vachellii]|uniref:ATPase AAA-type core domain-containing protein n=1 Tax=Tachysurus vachellii TaxID=175792 RepID=A0AA88T6Q7_TACVA|nr:hypothetical protein Q7C36_001739 [Tachysurus vachellii]